MSMVEYMCKLFYGRRGIQLTEEQFDAVVGRSPNGSQLRNIFSDLNNNNSENNNENRDNIESSKHNDWMMRGWSAFGPDDWTKHSPQCTNLHKSYFSPLQFSAFSFSFPQPATTFSSSSNKYFMPDTNSHDLHVTNTSVSQFNPNSQEFRVSDFNDHYPAYLTSDLTDLTNHSINSLRMSQPFEQPSTSYLDQSPTFSGGQQQDVRVASVFKSSVDKQDTPMSVHFALSPPTNKDFMIIQPDVCPLTNHRFYKSEYLNDRCDTDFCEIKSQRLDESSYNKIPSKMLNDDQQLTENRKSLSHLYRYQVMSPTVDSTVNSADQSFMATNNNNYFQSCSFDISYDVDYYKLHGYNKNNFADTTDLMANVRSLQHVCAVCGDHAACQHYGVRTCEGCKGFFKRTVQKSAVYVCLSGKNCPIDKRRRNRCQYCRFEKCLEVGMVKEVVRTDLLKGRRGRLPSKPKPPLREYSASPPVSFITAVVRAHVDTSPDIQNHDYSHYLKPFARHSGIIDLDDSIHLLSNILEQTIQILADWSSRIPGFSLLANHDQQILFHSNIIDIIILRIAFRIEGDSNKLVFCNGVVLDWSNYRHIPPFSWLEIVREFVLPVSNIDGEVVDLSTISCMVALCLLAYSEGLQDPPAVEKLQTSLIDALSKHQSMNFKKRTYLPSVLAKLTELKSYSQRVLEHLNLVGSTQPYNSVINKILFSVRHFETITWNI